MREEIIVENLLRDFTKQGGVFKLMEENSWATATLKEVPFWRDDMTAEEYEDERTYYLEHYNDVKDGTYIPLWKQTH